MSLPKSFSKWLLCLCFGLLSLTAHPANISIAGYDQTDTYDGFPSYILANTSPISISSTSGQFDYVFVDDTKIAYNQSSYWSTYTLDLSSYNDAAYHKLQIKKKTQIAESVTS